jgi:alpha-D-xyloside xylohydrolase
MNNADPIELRVYPGAGGSFNLYEDEGDNYDYEKGMCATIPLRWDDTGKVLTIGDRQGTYPGMLQNRTFRVVRVNETGGFGSEPDQKDSVLVKYSGRAIRVDCHDIPQIIQSDLSHP